MNDRNPQTERRDSERVEATFQVVYRTLDELVVAYTQNLSKGGLFVVTTKLLPVNAVIKLEIVLPGDGGKLGCIARVARVRGTEETGQGKPPGLAVEFLDMPTEHLAAIETFIAQKAVEGVREVAAEPSRRKLCVLVVDDDPIYLELAAQTLGHRGDEVITAEDGLAGLAACLKKTPDLVVTDVQMPKLDGWALLRTLRARPAMASTMVMFQTSLGGETERLRGYQLGVDDYLAKPYRPEELLLRVDRLVARSQGTGTARAQRQTRALRGDLVQVSLPTVLTMLEHERRTGVVLVVGRTTGRIYVRDGRPLAIELEGPEGRLDPMAAAVELMGWKTGLFDFVPQDVSKADLLDTSMQGLLLETARRIDEAGR